MKTLLVFLIFSGFSTFISSNKECFRRYRGGLEAFCCDNHFRKNKVCVECEPGTKSKNEEPCTPCSPGRFGRKCLHSCNCEILERCDNVMGCVLDIIEPSVKTEIRNTTRKTIKSQNASEVKEGLSEREIVLYSVGSSGSILLILFVFLITVCVRKYISKQHSNNPTVQPNDTDNEAAYSESLYESVDESAICDETIPIPNLQDIRENDNDIKSESELSSTKSEDSGYLHPYTTFTETKETQLYCTQINSHDSCSTSNKSENINKMYAYTNHYQELQDKEESLPASTSVYSDLTVVHYLELIAVTNNTESVSRDQLPNYRIPKRSIWKCQTYSERGNAYVQSIRQSPLGRFYSIQQLHSSSMNCKLLKQHNMQKAVKHTSI